MPVGRREIGHRVKLRVRRVSDGHVIGYVVAVVFSDFVGGEESEDAWSVVGDPIACHFERPVQVIGPHVQCCVSDEAEPKQLIVPKVLVGVGYWRGGDVHGLVLAVGWGD